MANRLRKLRRHRERMANKKSEELKQSDNTVLVHKVMKYQCEECGKSFLMFLEKGLEDENFTGEKHKPVPYTIKCKCGGYVRHINWQADIKLVDYAPLGKNMNYFANEKGCDCGVPVFVKEVV